MPLSEDQRQFSQSHLGIRLRPAPGSGVFKDAWSKAAANWDSAIETVDGQISKLQAALKTYDDTELAEIAEYGLNAITGNHKVRMTASIMELKAAGDAPAESQISAMMKRINAFSDHLATDPRVKATDANPFGVTMTVSATMISALDELRRAMRDVA